MIRINLQSLEILSRQKAIANAVNVIRGRSYADRNGLSKMAKCGVCRRRHRLPACKPVYAKYPEDHELAGKDRVTENYGRARGKRVLGHHSKKLLQLVDLTKQLYPFYEANFSDPEECMVKARTEAARILKKTRDVLSKRKRAQQKLSRRINRLLKKGNAVLRFNFGTPINSKTRTSRIEKQIKVTKERQNAGSQQS